MDIQYLIVGAIILLALLYIGKNVFAKVKSFSGKSSCANDCGCGAKSASKTLIQINKS